MKIALFVLIPLIVAGLVAGLAMGGFVQIPGLSPPSFGKPVLASPNPAGSVLATLTSAVQNLGKQIEVQAKAAAVVKDAPVTGAASTDKPKADPVKGDEKLAELWNGMDVAQIEKITKAWKVPDLAKVLIQMDTDHVTEFLGSLDPKRADEVSRAIQTLAAIPPPDSKPVAS